MPPAAKKTHTSQRSGLEEANSVRNTGNSGKVKIRYSVSNTSEFLLESGSSDQAKTHPEGF